MQKEVKEKIKILIEKYEKTKTAGRLKSYTEEETKQGFIVPLFEALGWDFSNKDEVSAEESMSAGRVDYGLYLNNRIKFYLEAKKFSVDLHNEDFANQTIRYSWNKGATWAILTDFESIMVFNAQDIKRSLADKLYFEIPYTEYLSRFEQLWLLSKESFQNDSLDKDAEAHGKKFQKVPVTALLYEDLEKCRDILTKELGQMNDKVSPDLLDEGVQKLLDRLIFIRVAEDRGVEDKILIPLAREARFGNGGGKLYESMVKKFRELDGIYNSNLFQSHPFEHWEDYSFATEKVINILYGEKGYYEYDFKAMPADVLGAVYESYLGHRLSKSKKGLTVAKDAGKRKERGIYYTPSFIVDYIVKNTLGPVLDRCKTVHDLKKIKVLDPACGSGSFLIKALEMINEKYKKFGALGNTYTKIQILTENIYGVDLDEQAVEIARLNLLINALDERLKLPLLTNIKRGNSLISDTDEELERYFGKNFKDKKPFNWQEEFSAVFEQGGFDVIIGNPPYVNLANIDNIEEREYLKKEYKTAKNKCDLYSFFVERGVTLLKQNGSLGFIVSNSWLGTDSFSKFRKYLIENTVIKQMVELPLGVFEQVTVTPVLLFFEKRNPSKNHKINLFAFADGKFKELSQSLSYQRILESPNYNFSFNPKVEIKIPIVKLGDIAKLSLGIKTSNDGKFILDKKIDSSCYKLLRGKDVDRYSYKYADKWIWYKPDLMMQKVGAGPRHLEYFLRDKILFRNITGGSIIATLDEDRYLTNDKVNILYEIKEYSLKFILGVVNSKFVNFWIKATFNDLLEIKINQLQNIPVPRIDFSNKTEKTRYDELIKLADKILGLNKEIQKITENSNEWNSIKSEMGKTDKKIDTEVYKFYGLTPEEIKIVEGH